VTSGNSPKSLNKYVYTTKSTPATAIYIAHRVRIDRAGARKFTYLSTRIQGRLLPWPVSIILRSRLEYVEIHVVFLKLLALPTRPYLEYRRRVPAST
jgi:hypothetical protein